MTERKPASRRRARSTDAAAAAPAQPARPARRRKAQERTPEAFAQAALAFASELVGREDADLRDRLTAAKLVLEYTLPKAAARADDELANAEAYLAALRDAPGLP